jgi:hypothetical protein
VDSEERMERALEVKVRGHVIDSERDELYF